MPRPTRRFPGPTRPHAGESGTASATAGSPCQTTAAATGLCRQGVQGGSPKAVVWVKETAPARHPKTVVRWHRLGFRLYWSWLVADWPRRREEILEQGSARPDFPHGRGEPDVGREQSTML